MPLILMPYLNHAFDNILPEFEPSGSIILVPRVQNVKTPNFDLWPDLDLKCDRNLKLTYVILERLVESSRMPPRTTLYDQRFAR